MTDDKQEQIDITIQMPYNKTLLKKSVFGFAGSCFHMWDLIP